MLKEELLEQIKIGEGYTLELKETIGNSLGKEICAFANASGGKIILGVKDNGSIVGYKLTNSDIQIIGRKRVETLEISEEALREAIINAMVHRDYFSNGRIQIDVFSDRIEISNPGWLLFDEKDFGNISIARNPIIADIAHRLGYVERIGSGIKRIRELVKNVKFNFSSNWFRVIFLRKTTPQITPLEKEMIELIKKDNQITRKLLSNKLNIGEDTVKEYLARLRKKGKLKRIGTKGGYWVVR